MAGAAIGAVLSEGGALAGARRSAAAVFGIRVAGAALAYGTQVLFARLMGTAGYGVFGTAWVWIAILGHASLWGLGQSVCRFVPHHRARGELDLTRGFLAGGALVTLASALAIAATGALVLWLGQERIGAAYVSPLALALLVLPVFALQDYLEGVARSFDWAALAIAPPYILRQALLSALMALAVAVGAPAEPTVAIGCTLVATALAVAIQAALLVNRLRRAMPPGPRAYRLRQWTTATLPIGFVDLTLSAFNFVDVLILGLFMAPEAVGIYFAATRVFQLVAFAQYAASAATAQRYAAAWARADHAGLRDLLRGTARLTSLATLALGAGLLIAAPLLLALFGPGFSASFDVLAVLVCGAVVQSAFGPAEDCLNMLGAERVCALVSLGALGLAIVLNLVLIPWLGVIGAATAMALSGAARAFGLSLAARLRLGLATHVLA